MNDPSFRGNVNPDANVDVSVNLDIDLEGGAATDEDAHGHENKYVVLRER